MGISGIGRGADDIGGLAARGALGAAEVTARLGDKADDVARALIERNTTLYGLNLKEKGLAEDLARLAQRDPAIAAEVADALRGQLSASNYRQVSDAMPGAVLKVEDQALAARGVSKIDRDALLDMTQMGLDIVGIFDPTPVSDGVNGAISLARGDWLGAGISAVSMVPYIGDLAKAGKIGKWAQTVANGAELVARYGADSVVGRQALAAMAKIDGAIGAIPDAVLSKLPDSTRAQLDATRATIEGAVSRATGRGAAEAAETGAKREVIELEAGRKRAWNRELNGKLKPDADYVVNGYTYKTDAQGRVDKVSGQLDLGAADRNSYQQRVSGRADRLADDHGGHLIASMFGGPGEGINLVPMNKVFNGSSGSWYKLESKLKAALEAGSDVKVRIDLSYTGTSKRPDALTVTYEIDGVSRRRVMPNKAP